MNEKSAKKLRRETRKTYAVTELVSKYGVDPRTHGTAVLTGVKAIYKRAKKNHNRSDYVLKNPTTKGEI